MPLSALLPSFLLHQSHVQGSPCSPQLSPAPCSPPALPCDRTQLRAEWRMALPKPTMKRSGTNQINPCHALSLSLFLYLLGKPGFTGQGKLLGNVCWVRTKRYLDMHPGCAQEEGTVPVVTTCPLKTPVATSINCFCTGKQEILHWDNLLPCYLYLWFIIFNHAFDPKEEHLNGK